MSSATPAPAPAPDVSPLFEPLTLGPIVIPNRIIMAALTRSRSVPTNIPNELNLEYYIQRARGGAGLIVTEGVLVSPQGSEWPNAPGLWNVEQVNGWKKITEAVHLNGSYIYAQLWHTGRVSHPDAPEQNGKPVLAPSAIAARGGKFRHIPGCPHYVTPTYMENPGLIVEGFRNAAKLALDAGFDGVELHGANGYLINQFIDSTSNTRTDEWGGSPENRCRFPLELLKACVSVFGKGRVAIKLSPTGGYNDMGMPLDETIATFKYLLTEADKLGLAYICLQRYIPHLDVTIDGKLRATPHDILQTYRPFIINTPLVLNAGLTAPEAASFVASGQISAASFGMPWIAHPDFAKRVKHGKALDGVVDLKTLYGGGPTMLDLEEQRKGYSDYPEAVY